MESQYEKLKFILRKRKRLKTKNDKKKLDTFQLVIQIVFSQRAFLNPDHMSLMDFAPNSYDI